MYILPDAMCMFALHSIPLHSLPDGLVSFNSFGYIF